MSTSQWILFLCPLICFIKCSTFEEIKAKSEEDVILHCRAPGDSAIKLLKWVRPDLKSEGYVYFFRESQKNEDYQHPLYRGRVELKDPQINGGDVCVILKKVNIDDTGTYECYVGQNNTVSHPNFTNIIHLMVDFVEKNITTKPGETVTLPCEVPRNTTILVVEWIRPDLEPEYVFWYKSGQSDPKCQHPSFKNRVELKDGGMKDGNLSVILKNVTIDDTGTYECHVYQSQRNHTMSIINLNVHQPGGGAGHTEDGGDKDGGDKDGGEKDRGDKGGGDKYRGDKDRGDQGGGDKNGGHVVLPVVLSVVAVVAVVAVVGFVIYRKRGKRLNSNRGPADEEDVEEPLQHANGEEPDTLRMEEIRTGETRTEETRMEETGMEETGMEETRMEETRMDMLDRQSV